MAVKVVIVVVTIIEIAILVRITVLISSRTTATLAGIRSSLGTRIARKWINGWKSDC